MEKSIKEQLQDEIKKLSDNTWDLGILDAKFGAIKAMPYYKLFDQEHQRNLDLQKVETDLQLKYSERKEILTQISILAEMEAREYQSILNQN